MKKQINRLIKNSVMDGLHRAKYDLEMASPGRLARNRQLSDIERLRALDFANYVLAALQKEFQNINKNDPPSKQEVEIFVDAFIAEKSFLDAWSILKITSPNSFRKDRSDKTLMRECEDAITTLRNCGDKYSKKAGTYDLMFWRDFKRKDEE